MPQWSGVEVPYVSEKPASSIVMIDNVGSSDTSLHLCQTARRHIQENSRNLCVPWRMLSDMRSMNISFRIGFRAVWQ